MPLIHQHTPEDLRLAYVYRVYFRFQTYARNPLAALPGLDRQTLAADLTPYGLHLLDLACDDTDLIAQVSLRPEETVAACASKLKGRLSKWLRAHSATGTEARLLAKGYFAFTVGDNTGDTVLAYLEKQGDHHGYLKRPLPPVFVAEFAEPAPQEVRLAAAHNVSLLRFHLVLGTQRRRGVFTQVEAQRLAAAWQALQGAERFALLKASFVPDHVHLAVRVHPVVAPRTLVATLMNAGERLLGEEFVEVMIRYSAGGRLWECGGYVGSFGDLNSLAVRRAMARWRRGEALGPGW